MTRKRSLSRIGLDVGASAVRAVQLRREGRGWTVRCAVEVPRRRLTAVPAAPAAASQKAPEAPPPAACDAALAADIGLCLSQAGFRGRRVAVGLSAPDVELLTLELPPRGDHSASDYEQMARIEIQRLIAREQGASELAFWSLPRGTGRSPTAIGVAAPRDTVQALADVCHEAGADCDVIDVSACAMVRAALLLAGPRDGNAWGVLDLGDRQARLAVCLGETPVLVRSLGDGGRGWTQRLAEELKISEDAAEVHKCDVGIEPSNRGVRRSGAEASEAVQGADGAARKELGAILFGVLRASLGRLVTEIERSYSYVLSCYPNAKPVDLLLAGGGGAMRGLAAYLGEALGICVRPMGALPAAGAVRLPGVAGTTTSRVGSAEERKAVAPLERFAAAVGLALEGGTP